jgi:hypothetical protein
MAESVSPRFIAFNDSDFRLHDEAAFNAGWDALMAEIGPLVADLYTTNHIHENIGDRAHNAAVERLRNLVRDANHA